MITTIGTTAKIMANEVIKNNNQTHHTGLATDKADSEISGIIGINPIILATFVTISLDPKVIKTIDRIQKPNNSNKIAAK